MELVITRQALQFLQSILLGISAGALYDILRPFRALLPRLTGVLDFLYGLTLTFALLAFLMRPADGELRGYMALGVAGGLILFYGLLSRPLRPIWRFWADALAAAVKISLAPLVRLKVFLKKSARGGKNLFYFAEKCYTIKRGFRGGRVERPTGNAGGRAGKSVRKTGAGKSAGKTGGVRNGPKKKQNGTKTASCERRRDCAGAGGSHRHGLASERTARSVGNRQV